MLESGRYYYRRGKTAFQKQYDLDEVWASKYVFEGSVKTRDNVTVIKEKVQDMTEIQVFITKKVNKCILKMISGTAPKDYKPQVFKNY